MVGTDCLCLLGFENHPFCPILTNLVYTRRDKPSIIGRLKF